MRFGFNSIYSALLRVLKERVILFACVCSRGTDLYLPEPPWCLQIHVDIHVLSRCHAHSPSTLHKPKKAHVFGPMAETNKRNEKRWSWWVWPLWWNVYVCMRFRSGIRKTFIWYLSWIVFVLRITHKLPVICVIKDKERFRKKLNIIDSSRKVTTWLLNWGCVVCIVFFLQILCRVWQFMLSLIHLM